LFGSNPSSWSWRGRRIFLSSVTRSVSSLPCAIGLTLQAILRCLYAYFLALPQEELPYIKIPLHTLIKITPMAYGCHEERYPLPIAAVDTHRAKPSRKRVGSVGAADATTVNPDAPRAAPARDYFGDVSQHMQKHAQQDAAGTSQTAKPALSAVEAVQAALERDADQGLLTPKAVKGP